MNARAALWYEAACRAALEEEEAKLRAKEAEHDKSDDPPAEPASD